ncbi:probable serine/threonine-protein kinase roco5 [Saccostrea cucullata]|uniref:probable serine/threonine-protein kinase roco5 n=1 Tax=Saccostrea cuccullata TaxID=36930 RepID=UPI002ED4F1DD
MKNDIAKIHSNTPHLDETNTTTDPSSKDNREINYFSLNEDVREGKFSDSKHLKDSDRIISEELRKVGIHLDGYEVWKTEMSVKIPEEVLQWELDARKRYLEYLKKGKTPIFRARAMIVGCAGAGKTTLLERLQKKSMKDIQKIESTVGLDVHNDIFEVLEKEGKLEVAVCKSEPSIHIKENVPIDHTEKTEETKLLSILDFGGQCMYYACHQIYLSKRAFYILVVDMSKNLEDIIDEELCDQKDTMFSKWSYRDYLLFWLKSVDCYCGREAPVVLVATHAEGKSQQEKANYYKKVIETFPATSTIKEHLSSKRYFTICLPRKGQSSLENLTELERCIVEVAKTRKQWGEEVPKDWAKFEEFILEEKTTKIQSLLKLKKSFDKLLPLTKQEFADLLHFYHDIGLIIYYSFRDNDIHDYIEPYSESDVVVVDIQWFVNSFKYVVTDLEQENVTEVWNKATKTDVSDEDQNMFEAASTIEVFDAAATIDEFNTFKDTGEISGRFLKAIWENTGNTKAVEYKDDMIKYMERLGIMAIEEKSDVYFIPSMNRMRVPEHERVLVLGVSKSYIQLMLYDDQKQGESMLEAFKNAKQKILKMLSSLTKTFTRDLSYDFGYSCTNTEFEVREDYGDLLS